MGSLKSDAPETMTSQLQPVAPPVTVREPRTAVVTGSARGIGLATARRLADDGYEVLLFDRDEAAVTQASRQIAGSRFVVGDVRSAEDIDRTLEAFDGRVDVLVNNAGLPGRTAPIQEQTDDDWNRVIEILLTSPFRWCRAVVPYMRRAGWGRIVNIASVAGKEGNPNLIPYSVAKAGVICLTKALAKEVVDAGILVNAIAPAVIDTALLGDLPREQIDYMASRIPLGRLGTAEEVAAGVSFLVNQATFTTGQTLDLSGGRCTY